MITPEELAMIADATGASIRAAVAKAKTELLAEINSRFELLPKPEKGERGDPGERGPQGEIGPQGPAGKDGERGETGPQGERGEVGAPGEIGPQGERGLPGESVVGPQGPKGDTGERGEPGPHGLPGERGEKGEIGERGEQGPAGRDGVNGEIGPAGPQGERGLPGESITGPQGPQGERGEQGPQGHRGDIGERGEKGIDGKDGRDGRDGKDGINGRDGLDGEPGRDALEIDILPLIDPSKSYPRGTFAKHAGGLFRAMRNTAPGESVNLVDWDCIIDAPIAPVVRQSEDLRSFTIEFRMASGITEVQEFKMPVVIHRGVYKSGNRYECGDQVQRNGSTWICVVESTTAVPDGVCKEWILSNKAGRDGKDLRPEDLTPKPQEPIRLK